MDDYMVEATVNVANDANGTEPGTVTPVTSTASSGASSPAPSSPSSGPAKPKKKRLTLQERLALATKGKNGNGDLATAGSDSVPESVSQPAETSTSEPPNEASPSPDPGSDSKQPEQQASQIDQSKEPQIGEPQKEVPELVADSTKSPEVDTLKSDLTKAQSEISRLQKEMAKVQAQNTALKSNSANTKLAKKDEVIDQLMKEGEALSIKELKLNETIKKMKSTNRELEATLEDYNQKNEDNVVKLSEINLILNSHGVKSNSQLSEILTAHKQYSSEDFKQKYLDQVKLYNDEVNANDNLTKKSNDLIIQLDLVKQKHTVELESKERVIANLKSQLKTSKQSTHDEILRLENQVEHLRIISESGDIRTVKSDGDDQESIKNSDTYNKLYNNYSNLQTEYLNSKENWNLIEINYENKISELNSVLDQLKKTKFQLIHDNKSLKNLLTEKDAKLSELLDTNAELNEEISNITTKLTNQSQELSELLEKLNKINVIYNNEKGMLNSKLKALEAKYEELVQSRENDQFVGSVSMAPTGSTLSIPPTPTEFSKPLHSRSNSIYNQSFNMSSQSFDNDNDSLEFDSSSMMPPNSTMNSQTHANSTSFQLINKMSSTIRTLKIELNSLKDENASLAAEKDQLENKLLTNFNNLSSMDELNQRLEELEEQISEKAKAEDNLLLLLGEKEERVEELVNDVQDLKDLCKLQVQQMIELQESH